MSPEVLFEDNHLLVINKPAGMLSQGDRTGDRDVVTWAREYLREHYNKPGNVFVGLVHRLDRPASGVMVLARTSKAAGRLVRAFADRDTGKKYAALVQGSPTQSGTAEDWLAKADRRVRVVSSTHPGARRALLGWTVIGQHGGQTLVEVDLETGRAHQIRVQMASRGFPLVGDLRYGATSEFDGRNLALHARSLTVPHPIGGRPVTWTASLPVTWPDWAKALVDH